MNRAVNLKLNDFMNRHYSVENAAHQRSLTVWRHFVYNFNT